MFYSKTFKSKDHFVVAICDDNLLGKEIGESFEVKEDFYGKELVDEQKALDLMKKASIGNIVGKRIVDLALKGKFITKENVMFIGGTSHAQFIR